jgi:hypothetical protein
MHSDDSKSHKIINALDHYAPSALAAGEAALLAVLPLAVYCTVVHRFHAFIRRVHATLATVSETSTFLGYTGETVTFNFLASTETPTHTFLTSTDKQRKSPRLAVDYVLYMYCTVWRHAAGAWPGAWQGASPLPSCHPPRATAGRPPAAMLCRYALRRGRQTPRRQ